MKLSHGILDFIGFAMLVFLGIAGLWICRRMIVDGISYLEFFVFFCVAGSLLLVGILGMIISLVEWLISGVIAQRRGNSRFLDERI
jgi:hypothetical protein